MIYFKHLSWRSLYWWFQKCPTCPLFCIGFPYIILEKLALAQAHFLLNALWLLWQSAIYRYTGINGKQIAFRKFTGKNVIKGCVFWYRTFLESVYTFPIIVLFIIVCISLSFLKAFLCVSVFVCAHILIYHKELAFMIMEYKICTWYPGYQRELMAPLLDGRTEL